MQKHLNKNLTDLKENEYATVSAITANGTMRRRLLDLGITEGTEIFCSLKSPYGDPTAYIIKNAVIALRNEDAKNILVG